MVRSRSRHLKASNEPGRVALVCRIVSRWSLAAFIAAHLGAKLVEGHGAEHWYSLAQHFEGHPNRPLAALAADPRITVGFKLGDGAVVGHSKLLP